MKKNFFLITTFLCLVQLLAAQTTFQKIYGDSMGSSTSMTGFMTNDGGFFMFATSNFASAGSADYYSVRTDSNGVISWTGIYGASNFDPVTNAVEAHDGGFLLGGHSISFGNPYDAYLVRTGANGNLLWSKTYSVSGDDAVFSMLETSDHGFIVAGSSEFGVSGNSDMWVFKIDSVGGLLWSQVFGTANHEVAYSITQTTDGAYMVAGTTSYAPVIPAKILLSKIDDSGNVLWSKSIGGGLAQHTRCVKQTFDGGFIFAGWTFGTTGDSTDAYLVKTDSSGNLQWTKVYGGTGYDEAHFIEQTSDSGYIVTGRTFSFGTGDTDVLLFKTDAAGNLVWSRITGGSNDEAATYVATTGEGGYAMVGFTSTFGLGLKGYLVKTDASGYSGCNDNTVQLTTGSLAPIVSTIAAITHAGASSNAVTTIVNSAGTSETLCSSVGIEHLYNLTGPGIFPNPSTGQFEISFPGFISKGTVVIYSALGIETGRIEINNRAAVTIHLENNAPGIYFVTILDGANCYRGKIILN